MPCQRRGHGSSVCEWVHDFLPHDLYQQTEYIRLLEGRLNDMEQRLQVAATASVHQQPIISDPLPVVSDALNSNPEAACRSPVAMVTKDRVWPGGVQIPTPDSQEGVPDSQQPTPAVLGPPSECSLREKYRWSSSAGSFMSHVHRMAGKPQAEPRKPERQVPLYPKTQCNDNRVPREAAHYVLPPRRLADSLLETYWTHIHTLYPIIARRVTMADYEALWTADGTIHHEQSFQCLFNIMLALASMLHTTNAAPFERVESAGAFYQRARGLFDHSNQASLRNVQICLLFGLYLQSTDELHDCWMHVGMAVRIAQGLGLHLAQTSMCHSDGRERVLLQRVWYGCVMLDRSLAMVSGRPCTIHRTEALAVDRPTAVDGECFPNEPNCVAESGQIRVKPSIVDFFNSTLTLYDILYDILRAFYSETRKAPELLHEAYGQYFDVKSRSSIPCLDERLCAWEHALPSFLKIQSHPEDCSITDLSRQAVLLRQRFLHTRILSLRPAMSALIVHHDREHSNGVESLRTSVVTSSFVESSLTCFRAAQEAIKIAYSKRGADARAFIDLSWSENILFVYTAVTCIIAAGLKRSLFPEITLTAIGEAWQQAITVLQQYTAISPSFLGMFDKLKLLYNSVFSKLVHDDQSADHHPLATALPGARSGDALLFDFGNTTSAGASLPDFATLLTGNMAMPMDSCDTLLFHGDDSWLDLSPFQP